MSGIILRKRQKEQKQKRADEKRLFDMPQLQKSCAAGFLYILMAD